MKNLTDVFNSYDREDLVALNKSINSLIETVRCPREIKSFKEIMGFNSLLEQSLKQPETSVQERNCRRLRTRT